MFNRYGIYVAPEGNRFAKRGASWLGWDIIDGHAIAHPKAFEALLLEATHTPRKYGFHATIKPPFHLAENISYEKLLADALALCSALDPFEIDILTIQEIGSTIALVPTKNSIAIAKTEATVLQSLDHFRAPVTKAGILRHQKSNLSPLQETNLQNWGYPYVLDAFKLHFTLSSKLTHEARTTLKKVAQTHFADDLKSSHPVTSLMLVGESGDGRFHALHRLPLGKSFSQTGRK